VKVLRIVAATIREPRQSARSSAGFRLLRVGLSACSMARYGQGRSGRTENSTPTTDAYPEMPQSYDRDAWRIRRGWQAHHRGGRPRSSNADPAATGKAIRSVPLKSTDLRRLSFGRGDRRSPGSNFPRRRHDLEAHRRFGSSGMCSHSGGYRPPTRAGASSCSAATRCRNPSTRRSRADGPIRPTLDASRRSVRSAVRTIRIASPSLHDETKAIAIVWAQK